MSRESKEALAGQAIYAARIAEAAVDRFDRLAAEALGINRTDARCLDILDNEGGTLSAGRLAELSGLTTAAITAVLDRLEGRGYVRRVRDERDRRRVLVEVTPLLRRRMQRIWGPLAEEGAHQMGRFTREELEGVIRWFHLTRDLNDRHAERIAGLRLD